MWCFLREGFHVIQLCNPPDFLILDAWPYKVLGKRIIFDHHDLSPEVYLSKNAQAEGSMLFRFLMFFERLTLRGADVVLSTNESYKKIVMDRGGVREDRAFVVRNGPRLSDFVPRSGDVDLHHGKPLAVLYVGFMGAQDGVDYLLRSVRYLVHECGRDDFHLTLVGGGPEVEHMRRYAAELGIDSMVTITGFVPEETMFQAYFEADVCVCPDPLNPLNDISTMHKTVNYMAAGKPMVAYDLHETRVSAGNAALYAQPNDEHDFGDRLAELLDSEEMRRTLGAIGRKRIEEGLSWDAIKAHLYAAYDCTFSLF